MLRAGDDLGQCFYGLTRSACRSNCLAGRIVWLTAGRIQPAAPAPAASSKAAPALRAGFIRDMAARIVSLPAITKKKLNVMLQRASP